MTCGVGVALCCTVLWVQRVCRQGAGGEPSSVLRVEGRLSLHGGLSSLSSVSVVSFPLFQRAQRQMVKDEPRGCPVPIVRIWQTIRTLRLTKITALLGP